MNERAVIYFIRQVERRSITATDFRIGISLASLANDKGIVSTSYADIASKSDVNKRTAINSIDRLIEIGIVKKSKMKSAKGVNYYRIEGFANDRMDVSRGDIASQAVTAFSEAYYHNRRFSSKVEFQRAERIIQRDILPHYQDRKSELPADLTRLAKFKVNACLNERGERPKEEQIRFLPKAINYFQGGNMLNDLESDEFKEFCLNYEASQVKPNDIAHLSDNELNEVQKRARIIHRRSYSSREKWQ